MPTITSVRVRKDFIKLNKEIMGKMTKKKKIIENDQNEKLKESHQEKIKEEIKIKPIRSNLKANDSKTVQFAAVSPKVFRKSTISSELFQNEIKKPKLDQRRPSMRFDPAFNRRAPVYLDIPDLYTRRKRSEMDPISYHQGVVKVEGSEGGKSSYFFVPRPKTPRKYEPQTSSSNRYVRVEKRRYTYIPRPATPKNYKPRPKSSRRYVKRYSYPAARKTVFKFIGRYKYEPRPKTPKNYLPRPKSSSRYVSVKEAPEQKHGSYIYRQRPQTPKNFKPSPKEGDRYKKRYTFPAPRRTVFKFIGRYTCKQNQSNPHRVCSGGNRYVYSENKRYIYKSRPKSAKNFNPRPKSGIRYAKRYTYPTCKKTVGKFIGRYKFMPRPPTPKNYLPRPKSSNRYFCQNKGDIENETRQNTLERKSIFKPKWRYVCKELTRSKSAKIIHEVSEKKEAEQLEINEKKKKVVTIEIEVTDTDEVPVSYPDKEKEEEFSGRHEEILQEADVQTKDLIEKEEPKEQPEKEEADGNNCEQPKNNDVEEAAEENSKQAEEDDKDSNQVEVLNEETEKKAKSLLKNMVMKKIAKKRGNEKTDEKVSETKKTENEVDVKGKRK